MSTFQAHEWGHTANPTVMAVDAVQQLLAIGFYSGKVLVCRCDGAASRYLQMPLMRPIRFLAFRPNLGLLLCVDAANQMTAWNLARMEADYTVDHFVTHLVPITCIDVVPECRWCFVGTGAKGQVFIVDLDRGAVLHAAAIPFLGDDASDTSHASASTPPPVVSVLHHPQQPTLLLIGYESGLIALCNVATQTTMRLYRPCLGGTLTALAWRPDGQFFACGSSKGQLAIWSFKDAERPVLVRAAAFETPSLDCATNVEPVYQMLWLQSTVTPEDAQILVSGSAVPEFAGLHSLSITDPPTHVSSQRYLMCHSINQIIAVPQALPYCNNALDAQTILIMADQRIDAFDFNFHPASTQLDAIPPPNLNIVGVFADTLERGHALEPMTLLTSTADPDRLDIWSTTKQISPTIIGQVQLQRCVGTLAVTDGDNDAGLNTEKALPTLPEMSPILWVELWKASEYWIAVARKDLVLELWMAQDLMDCPATLQASLNLAECEFTENLAGAIRAYTADANLFALGGDDGRVIVFDYSTGQICFSQIVAPKDSISSMAFCAGFAPLKGQTAVAFDQFLLVGTAQGSMYRITFSFYAQESFETMEIECRHEFLLKGDGVTPVLLAVAFDSDGERMDFGEPVMRARVEPPAKPTISTKSKSAASALKKMLKPKSESLGHPSTLLLCVTASKASVYAGTSSLKCTVGPVSLATAKEDFIATRAALYKAQGYLSLVCVSERGQIKFYTLLDLKPSLSMNTLSHDHDRVLGLWCAGEQIVVQSMHFHHLRFTPITDNDFPILSSESIYRPGINMPPRPSVLPPKRTSETSVASKLLESFSNAFTSSSVWSTDKEWKSHVQQLDELFLTQQSSGTAKQAQQPLQKPSNNSAFGQAAAGLAERGERLQNMEHKFADLAANSQGFLDQVRRHNERQANKKWFEF